MPSMVEELRHEGFLARPTRQGPIVSAPGSAATRGGDIARILSIAVPVSVTLAQQKMTIDSILGITVGSIIEFEVPSEAELTLCVGSSPVGMGQAVKVGEKFGLRVNRIGNIQQRIEAMGPH
ncbi:MAG: FliM/FliN family flagellar motor C-terminal domain-containing protein [Planctomycetota bacterium]